MGPLTWGETGCGDTAEAGDQQAEQAQSGSHTLARHLALSGIVMLFSVGCWECELVCGSLAGWALRSPKDDCKILEIFIEEEISRSEMK